MSEFMKLVLASSTISVVVVGGFVWLLQNLLGERIKNAIKHQYDQKLETHKAQLKGEYDVAAERMKSELQRATIEHQVRFARLHEKVADVVAETYSRLSGLHQAVGRYTAIMTFSSTPPLNERRASVGEAMANFTDYYRSKKIYIPKHTADKIEKFTHRHHEITVDFMIGIEREDREYTDEGATWKKTYDAMTKEIPGLFAELESDFQSLLGMPNTAPPAPDPAAKPS